jgi:cobalt/nickel transport protein
VLALAGLVAAVVLAGLLSPFASSRPDGLERVAQDKGFADTASGKPVFPGSPMPDYTVPGVADQRVSTALAGVVGTALAFGLAVGAAWGIRALRGRRRPGRPQLGG